MKQIHIKLPEQLHKELKIQVAINGTTIQDYVIKAIIEQIYSDNPKQKSKKNIDKTTNDDKK